jgi:hypothetical protein
MKIFISGQIDESASIKKLFELLKSENHEITHDWTKTDKFLGDRESKLANLEESGRRAEADIQGVLDCDIYILSSDNKNVGKGMYVELGAALALKQSKLTNLPEIYIIGPLNHMSIFYLHPLIKRRDNITEVLEELSKINH